MAVVDWSDPCARAGALSQAYYALMTGGRAVSIEIRSGESTRKAEYQAADINALRAEMERAQTECDRASGKAPRRHAIRAG